MRREINVFEILIVYICTVSILNVLLLILNVFYPLISLLIAIPFEVLILSLLKIKIVWKDARFSWLFLIVLIIGVGFRLNPNLYLTGGQDQGTYISLSKQYEENHSLYIVDNVRKSLPDELKNLYDEANTLLGIKLKDSASSEYVMPFYPVLPSWLAIGGQLFGSDNRASILTVFSLLSIAATYLFAYEISGKNKKVALLASLLVAVNPAHVYFSRVPLTEIISMTMFLLSFYYLIRFYNGYKEKQTKVSDLVMSLCTIAVLFYTRMTALLYLPVILLIPLVLMLFNKDNQLRKYLFTYCGIWLASLSLSYVFYAIFLPELFHLIIGKRFLGIELVWILLFFFAVYILILWLLRKGRIKEMLVTFVKKNLKYISIFAICILIGLVGYESISYIYTTFISNHNALFSDISLSNFKQLNFLATFLLISPPLFLLLPFSIFHFRKKYGKDIKVTLLLVLLIIFAVYCWGILKGIPYYYYYVRYQLGELIPLCIILISLYLVDIFNTKKKKILISIVLVLSIIYSCFFSVLQLRNTEGLKITELKQMQSLITENDVLLVINSNFDAFNQIIFPLKYYLGVDIVQIPSENDLINTEVKNLKREYHDVYILAADPGLDLKGLEKLQTVEFENNYFVHCNRSEDAFFKMNGHSQDIPLCRYIIIPNRYYYGVTKLNLYLWK